MIRIEIDSIPEGSSVLDLAEEARELDLVDDSGTVSLESPVRLHFDAMRSGEDIVLTGTATAELVLGCARCLKQFKMTVEAGLDILLIIGREGPVPEGECERDGVIRVPLSSRHADVTDEVRTELMVQLPVKPLCSPACKGLCPICGADLNESECSCRRDDHDSRWDALKKLK